VGDLAAGGVAEHDGRPLEEAGVLVAPLHHRDDHRVEVEPRVGQAVLAALALGALLVGPAREDAEVDEAAKAVGEDVAGDPRRLEVVLEGAGPEIGGAEDREHPALAEHRAGPRDRAVGVE
jgi:hypothetical protein